MRRQEGVADQAGIVRGDRDRQLVALPDEAAVDIPPQGRAGELLAAVPQERAERPPDVGRLQPVELAVKGREHVHALRGGGESEGGDRKSTRLNSSHTVISY